MYKYKPFLYIFVKKCNQKRRANGICDLCGRPAPFKDKKNRPYLESHHIVWLSRGGADNIENTVAVDPSCHRKLHILDLETDVNNLFRKVNNYSKI
ncbi:HNH endonuclease [Bacillus sp. SCS-153A]|uniref:HNH endonuclease n=1 Tax=Rossellomorea sedimentorum TaxID=3115294 RepID=UPI003905AE8F